MNNLSLKVFKVDKKVRSYYGFPCTINFNCKGLISFSSRAVEMIGIEDGDYLQFAQDSDRPRDWYIMKSEDKTGYQMRQRKEVNNKTMKFYCKPLSTSFIKSLDMSGSLSVNCKISQNYVVLENGEIAYPIITSSAKSV